MTVKFVTDLRPLLSDCKFKIGGKVIEFVSSYSHLGHVVA